MFVAKTTMNNPVIQVKRTSDKATVPKEMYPGASYYTIYSAEYVCIKGSGPVHLDLDIVIPVGFYGYIHIDRELERLIGRPPKRIKIVHSFIPPGISYNVDVLLRSSSGKTFMIDEGQAIGYLVLKKLQSCSLEEVTELNENMERKDNLYSGDPDDIW